MRDALEFTIAGKGFAFLEVLSPCPLNWGTMFAKADLWVVLSQRAIARIYPYLKDDTKVVVNTFLVKDMSNLRSWHPIGINAGKIAAEELKKPRVFNMVMMGAMVKVIPGLDKHKFLEALKKQFKSKYDKDPSLEGVNAKAFEIGYGLA